MNSGKAVTSNRIDYLDFLKGIAILLVVANHTSPYGLETISVGSIGFWLLDFWAQIFKLGVPLFLVISGFLLGMKNFEEKGNYRTFLRRQMPKVYLPMLAWSLPYLVLDTYQHGVTAKGVINFFVGGFSVYYFIFLILQFYLLLPFLQKIGKRLVGVILTGVLTIGYMMFLDYVIDFSNKEIPLILYAGFFPLFIGFYCLGIYLRHRLNETDRQTNRQTRHRTSAIILSVLSLIALVVAMFDVYFRSKEAGFPTRLGIRDTMLVFSLVFIPLLFILRDIRKPMVGKCSRFIVFLGKRSFGIYLIHLYILGVVHRVYYHIFPTQPYLVTQIALILSVVGVTFIVVQIAHKILPQKAVNLLGLW